MECAGSLVVNNVCLVSGCKKWQLKQAHLLTQSTYLVSLSALLVPATRALVEVEFMLTNIP